MSSTLSSEAEGKQAADSESETDLLIERLRTDGLLGGIHEQLGGLANAEQLPDTMKAFEVALRREAKGDAKFEAFAEKLLETGVLYRDAATSAVGFAEDLVRAAHECSSAINGYQGTAYGDLDQQRDALADVLETLDDAFAGWNKRLGRIVQTYGQVAGRLETLQGEAEGELKTALENGAGNVKRALTGGGKSSTAVVGSLLGGSAVASAVCVGGAQAAEVGVAALLGTAGVVATPVVVFAVAAFALIPLVGLPTAKKMAERLYAAVAPEVPKWARVLKAVYDIHALVDKERKQLTALRNDLDVLTDGVDRMKAKQMKRVGRMLTRWHTKLDGVEAKAAEFLRDKGVQAPPMVAA